MALIFNGTTLPYDANVRYNGTSLKKVLFNNATVWEKMFNILGALSNYTVYAQENRLYEHTTSKLRGYYSSTISNIGSCYSTSKFDITDLKTIEIVCSQKEGSNNLFGIYTGTAQEIGYGIGNLVKSVNLSVGTLTIDVSSLTGQYGIAMTNGGSGNSATITSVIGIYK